MCMLGDIVVIDKYVGDDGKILNRHSFVVINDKPGFIEGLNYDFVCNVMSSFKSEKQRMRKLRFEENIEITGNKIISNIKKNNRNGYIKADQLFFFDKNKIDYYVLGHISNELLNELMLIIMSLSKNNMLKYNISNISD